MDAVVRERTKAVLESHKVPYLSALTQAIATHGPVVVHQSLSSAQRSREVIGHSIDYPSDVSRIEAACRQLMTREQRMGLVRAWLR